MGTRKSKLDSMELPKLNVPEIPEDEEALDNKIREDAEKDEAANALFERAMRRSELQDIEWDVVHKIGILQLCFNEMADARRRLWETNFVANRLTRQMESATTALNAATESSDNIVNGVCDNIVKAQQTPMPVKLAPKEEEQLRLHREELMKKEKEAMDKMHEQFMTDLKDYYTKLARLRWSGEDGLALHGKWVKWIVGIALTSFLCTCSMLLMGVILFVNWLGWI